MKTRLKTENPKENFDADVVQIHNRRDTPRQVPRGANCEFDENRANCEFDENLAGSLGSTDQTLYQ